MEKERKEIFTVEDIVLIALFVALITICSFIRIPFGTIPFTLQTFGVFVTAGLLGTKRGLATIMVYILMGLIGVPVFGGAGGMAVLAGNAGGYIIGFIFSVLIIGLIISRFGKGNLTKRFAVSVVAMILGDAACFVVGTIQFMALTNMGLAMSLGYCVVPFIIPDLIKIVVATGFIESIRKSNRRVFK